MGPLGGLTVSCVKIGQVVSLRRPGHRAGTVEELNPGEAGASLALLPELPDQCPWVAGFAPLQPETSCVAPVPNRQQGGPSEACQASAAQAGAGRCSWQLICPPRPNPCPRVCFPAAGQPVQRSAMHIIVHPLFRHTLEEPPLLLACCLSTLPVELLALIAAQLDSPKDLCTFQAVSRDCRWTGPVGPGGALEFSHAASVCLQQQQLARASK